MNKKKSISFLFFLFFTISTFAQNTANKQSLKYVLSILESTFICNFNFRDTDLDTHNLNFNAPNTLEQALEILKKTTLFDYTLIHNRTVAVSKKNNLIKLCGTIQQQLNEDVGINTITTNYQTLEIASGKIFNLYALTLNDPVTITSENGNVKYLTAAYFSGEKCKKVYILDTVEQLQPILLYNYLAKGITQNIDGSSTIDYNEFDILPGLIEPDILKTIQSLPGIMSVNETVSNINIRGGTNDQSLILWDGIKMYQTSHFFGLISAFNPYLTSKVNIIKNGSSAFYGDGVSGIVAMETEQKVNDTYKASWGFNLISSDAFLDIPIGKKASIQLSGRKSLNSLVETPTYKSYFNKVFQNTEVVGLGLEEKPSNVNFTFFDVDGRLLYTPTKGDLFRFNFIVLGNQLDLTEIGKFNDKPVFRNSNLQQKNISTGLYYKKDFTSKFKTQIQFYGSLYTLEAVNSDIPDNQSLSQQNLVTESGIKITGTYKAAKKIVIEGGYQFNETGIENVQEINNPTFIQRDKQVLRTNSLFSQINYKISEFQTVISAGARLNKINKFNIVLVEPRLSINNKFARYFSVLILGELKSQTTSQIIDFQNDFLGVENRRWVLSSPGQIPIIKSKQISTGLTFKKNNWLFSAEGYLKEISGITSQSQGFQNQFENFKESGSYSIYGLDVLINKFYKNINTWLSYSYTDNTYEFKNFDPSQFPNNIHIKHALTSGINLNLNKFKVSAGVNWHTGKPTTLLINEQTFANELLYDAPNNANIRNFLRVDISAIYNFQVQEKVKALAGFSLWNILNRENTLNHYYRINNGTIEEINEKSLKLTPNFTFRVFIN